MPSKKKQRGREGKKKRNQVQQEAKKLADEQQAQRKAEEARRAELAAKTLLRAQMEAALQRQFGTPAIDEVITDIGRSLSTTTTITTVAGVAAASKPASSSSPTAKKQKENVVCCHSSSAEHFVAGSEYLKMVQSYVVLFKKYDNDNEDQRNAANNKFFDDKENKNVYLDGEFTNYVFALGVSLYLNLSSEEKERYYKLPSREQQIGTAYFELQLIIELGLHIKYFVVPFFDKTQSLQEQHKNRKDGNKYLKDIDTERGLIKCLHRETRDYCGCMASKNDEAKGMEKMERCCGCQREFLKKLMKKCDGCESVVYCSEQCQINNWLCHQSNCEIEQKEQAANTKDNEEEPATSKGIVHGSCDGNGNIGSCGHEVEDEIMTTKTVEAKAPPPHKIHTATNQNDNTDGTSTRKEASIVMEGRSTEFLASSAAAMAVTVPCKTPHPPSELRTNNDGVLKTNNNNNNNNNQH